MNDATFIPCGGLLLAVHLITEIDTGAATLPQGSIRVRLACGREHVLTGASARQVLRFATPSDDANGEERAVEARERDAGAGVAAARTFTRPAPVEAATSAHALNAVAEAEPADEDEGLAAGVWTALDSSCIAAVRRPATEDGRDALDICFQSGGVYRYEGVPEETATGLIAAPSAGRYFHRHLRGRYGCYRIEEDAAETAGDALTFAAARSRDMCSRGIRDFCAWAGIEDVANGSITRQALQERIAERGGVPNREWASHLRAIGINPMPA